MLEYGLLSIILTETGKERILFEGIKSLVEKLLENS